MFSAAFGKEFIVTKDNENREYRQKGKTLNFSISFGGSAFTLSKTLNIPKEEAQELINSFFKGFPKLKELFDTNKSFALRNGYILTNDFIKRKRTFPDWEDYKKLETLDYLAPDKHKLFMQLRGKIERRALNTPIQGTASDMMKIALVLIRKELLAKGIMPYDLQAPIKLVNVVHDECSSECTDEYSQEVSDIMKRCLEKAGSYLVKNITMVAEPVIKKHWDH